MSTLYVASISPKKWKELLRFVEKKPYVWKCSVNSFLDPFHLHIIMTVWKEFYFTILNYLIWKLKLKPFLFEMKEFKDVKHILERVWCVLESTKHIWCWDDFMVSERGCPFYCICSNFFVCCDGLAEKVKINSINIFDSLNHLSHSNQILMFWIVINRNKIF